MITAPTVETSSSTKALRSIDPVLDAPWRGPAAEVVGDWAGRQDLPQHRARAKRHQPAHYQGQREGCAGATRKSGKQSAEQRNDNQQYREDAARPRSCLAVPFEDFVLFNRAVSLVDADDQCEAECEGGHTDDDGGQDQDMRKRI